jgi:hypothetical protein
MSNDGDIRCPGCRGSKQVCGLGGIVGDCKLCKGVGKIKLIDRPVAVASEPIVMASEIISKVGQLIPPAIPWIDKSLPEPAVLPDIDKAIEAVNKTGSRAIYKRKK